MREVEAHESKLYSDLAPLYDKTFGKIFFSRLRSVIEALDIPRGARVLEVGAGTGISFPTYPRHCEVIGIDLAPDMLARAQEKILENDWSHIQVEEMNALDLKFPDNSFDYVMAFHVISVVPDPARMLAEARRVCRPGGVITIINHFRSPNPAIERLQRMGDPMFRWLGWTTLRLPEVLKEQALHVERQWKTSPRSLFTIVVGRNAKALQGGSARPIERHA